MKLKIKIKQKVKFWSMYPEDSVLITTHKKVGKRRLNKSGLTLSSSANRIKTRFA